MLACCIQKETWIFFWLETRIPDYDQSIIFLSASTMRLYHKLINIIFCSSLKHSSNFEKSNSSFYRTASKYHIFDSIIRWKIKNPKIFVAFDTMENPQDNLYPHAHVQALRNTSILPAQLDGKKHRSEELLQQALLIFRKQNLESYVNLDTQPSSSGKDQSLTSKGLKDLLFSFYEEFGRCLYVRSSCLIWLTRFGQRRWTGFLTMQLYTMCRLLSMSCNRVEF